MKLLKFIIVFGLIILTSCSINLKTISSGKKIDTRLVGVWYGSEKDKQIVGMVKKWELTRLVDGTFTINFTVVVNGESKTIKQTGKWWVKNGVFKEYHDISGNTDIYKYKVLNSDQIKFVAISMSMDMASENYEFIDTRKK
ncbi:MAG: hypothetical protein QM539_10565 [Alphaproteobacteria bacterium]|nr:hypothetical protein [Alphaproteobacteria bacterium]